MSDDQEVSYRFDTASLQGVTHTLVTFEAIERLGRPYRIELVLRIEDRDAELQSMLGQDAVITLHRGEFERRFCALISEVHRGHGEVESEHLTARLVLEPALALAGLTHNSRIFQEMSVLDILQEVLGTALSVYGRALELVTDTTFTPREYCVQYQESDLDFVQRLMEEDGLHYTFDHEGEVEVLRIGDTNDAYGRATSAGGQEIIEYVSQELMAAGHEGILRLEPCRHSVVTSLAVADFNWTQGGLKFSEEEAGEDPLGRMRESYEHGDGRSLQISSYEEGVNRYQSHDGEQQASRRLEAWASAALDARGTGRLISFSPGLSFEIVGHPVLGVDGAYLLKEVKHRSDSDEFEGAGYANTFECRLLSAPYRPFRKTEKPKIVGVQTALVTGPSGEEVHVDAHGRVKVQFHWDREGAMDERSSAWVRVKQEWAGAGWGFFWAPRIGMEAVVHFIDGDPDRPLITGCVYDGQNPVPYSLPDEKTKSTIKSNSSLGGGGFNELRFEDKAGDEEIYSHAQKDYNEEVGNDHTTAVHHDQRNAVEHDQVQTIDGNQTEQVGANQTMVVGANRVVTVHGNYDETIDGTETREVTGDVIETFAANETRTVGGDLNEDIGANENRTLGANQKEFVGGDLTQNIGAQSTVNILGSLSRTSSGSIETVASGSQTVTAVGGWSITAATDVNIIATAGAKLIFPGGVQRADIEWSTNVMGSDSSSCAMNVELFLEKEGITGIATGLWGVKIDLHLSEEATTPLKMSQKAMKAKMAAIMNEEDGLDTAMNATDAHL